jgi:acyl carrier protein
MTGAPLSEQNGTCSTIKRLIVQNLNLEGVTPESISDDQPLFGQGLGLDSVDALELVVALEKEFRISIESEEIDRKVFASVAHLAAFVETLRAPPLSGPPHA